MARKAEVLASYAFAAFAIGFTVLAALLVGWFLKECEPSWVPFCSNWFPPAGVTMIVWAFLGALSSEMPVFDSSPAGRLNVGMCTVLSMIGVFLLITTAVALAIPRH